MNKIYFILNKMLKFKVGASIGVCEVKVNMFYKILNNVKLYILLNISTLNFDRKLNLLCHFYIRGVKAMLVIWLMGTIVKSYNV
jgi:hypothetical protein